MSMSQSLRRTRIFISSLTEFPVRVPKWSEPQIWDDEPFDLKLEHIG